MAQPRTISTAPQSQGRSAAPARTSTHAQEQYGSSRLITIRTASTDGNRHLESLYDGDDGNGGVVHDDNGMPNGIAVTSFGGGAAGGGNKCAWISSNGTCRGMAAGVADNKRYCDAHTCPHPGCEGGRGSRDPGCEDHGGPPSVPGRRTTRTAQSGAYVLPDADRPQAYDDGKLNGASHHLKHQIPAMAAAYAPNPAYARGGNGNDAAKVAAGDFALYVGPNNHAYGPMGNAGTGMNDDYEGMYEPMSMGTLPRSQKGDYSSGNDHYETMDGSISLEMYEPMEGDGPDPTQPDVYDKLKQQQQQQQQQQRRNPIIASADGITYAIPVDDGGDDIDGYAVPTNDYVASGSGNAPNYTIPTAGLPLDLDGYVVDNQARA